MNQVKYLLSACLILTACTLALILFNILSSNQWMAARQTGSNIDLVHTEPASPSSKGKNIFLQNCGSCHALDKVITGPPLRGVEERGPWSDRKELIQWLKNPAAFISTTEYTRALQKQYGQIMPSFPQLSKEEVWAILDYIKNVPASPPAPSMPAYAKTVGS